jgi:predicted nucleic acid-binding Zn ribbon protein
MSDVVAPEHDDTKPCKVCGEPIKKSARVCIHCSNYQDWRSELSISSTVLSLLVALFSVLTVAVPVIEQALEVKNAKLLFAPQGQTDKFITIMASNTGIRPGSVTGGGLVLSMPEFNGNPAFSADIKLMIDGIKGGALIVEPGKSILVNLVTQTVSQVDKDNLRGWRNLSGAECTLGVVWSPFTGLANLQLVNYVCGPLTEFILGVASSTQQAPSSQ